mmetsp:Transcript_123317/g.354306  ORF Transcript_123317/g.354306 Transcript_123317/m.354306 type:complete len:292 (-) Transcript_123317:1161-2036(-)
MVHRRARGRLPQHRLAGAPDAEVALEKAVQIQHDAQGEQHHQQRKRHSDRHRPMLMRRPLKGRSRRRRPRGRRLHEATVVRWPTAGSLQLLCPVAVHHGLHLHLLPRGQRVHLHADAGDADIRPDDVPEDVVGVEGRIEVLLVKIQGPQPPRHDVAESQLFMPTRRAVLVHRPSSVDLGLVQLGHPHGHRVVHAPEPEREVAVVRDGATAEVTVVKIRQEVGLTLLAVQEGADEHPDKAQAFGDCGVLLRLRLSEDATVAEQGLAANTADGDGGDCDVQQRPHDASAALAS